MGAGHGILLLVRPWPTRNRQSKHTALLHVHSGEILQPMVDGIGLSGKDRVYRPTRSKLRLHIGADIGEVAGDVIHQRTACGGTPAGNFAHSEHPNRQRPKQPRQPKQGGRRPRTSYAPVTAG